LHVNPRLPAKALLVVHNPLAVAVQRRIEVDFTYAALGPVATMRPCGPGADGAASEVRIDARGRGTVPLSLPPRGFAAFEFR